MFKKRFFFILVFAVFVLYTKEMSACEVLNSSLVQMEEIPISGLCESSLEALVISEKLYPEEADYLEIVIEITEVQAGQMSLYIQVWDGDYLRYATQATEYFEEGYEWVSLPL